jgi:hypothetical protein
MPARKARGRATDTRELFIFERVACAIVNRTGGCGRRPVHAVDLDERVALVEGGCWRADLRIEEEENE